MKYLFILLITFLAHANIDRSLVELKSKNYITTEKMYTDLKKLSENMIQFCDETIRVKNYFFNIFNDDHKLISHLRNFRNDLWLDYAKHLEENAASDLFSIEFFLHQCTNSFNSEAIQRSIEGSLINLNFLMMYHQQFLQTIED